MRQAAARPNQTLLVTSSPLGAGNVFQKMVVVVVVVEVVVAVVVMVVMVMVVMVDIVSDVTG